MTGRPKTPALNAFLRAARKQQKGAGIPHNESPMDNLIESLDEMLSKVHEGNESKDFKTGMFRGIEAVKMLINREF